MHFFLLTLTCCIALINTIIIGTPYVNLGSTNFLDGGPIRPEPGFYWFQNAKYYHADQLLDICGNPFNGKKSPYINVCSTSTSFVYQSARGLPRYKWGIAGGFAIIASNHVSHNCLGISAGGKGMGDTGLGIYIQSDPIYRYDRPFFVHRLEFDVVFPTGSNKKDPLAIYPGNGMIYINPYWAATLYFTEKLAASWRLHYLWCGKNHQTKIRDGQAFHGNYSLAYKVNKQMWWGLNGYFLRQLNDDTLCGTKIPNSKERIFAAGPGLVFFVDKDLVFFGHLYFESFARNRFQGISSVVSLVKHF
jgi:anthranilate 1,2-dioxygenase (deaminating, decarboxylating) large subunit